MKRHSRSRTLITIVGLAALLSTLDQSLAQGLELSQQAAKLAGGTGSAGQTNSAGAAAETPFGAAGQFTLPGAANPAGTREDLAINPRAHIILPDGTIYEGETVGGLPSGHGTLTDLLGTHQEGEWRNGKPYRLSGVCVYPDGTREEGTWNIDGTKSGGTITWPDGRTYKGDWKIVSGAPELPNGSGTMTWPDGRQYVGEFQDGRMDGKGVMKYPNGKAENGLWKQGKFAGPAKE
jgi:hypothetical protein